MNIKINNYSLQLSEIRDFDNSVLNEYEAKVFQLIINWIDHKNEFIFQTSGSTGTPKKIIAKRTHLEASSRRTLQYLNTQNNTILNCLSVDHIGGAMQVIRALTFKLNLTILTPSQNPFSDTDIVWKNIALLSLVPYQLSNLLSSGNAPSLKQCKAILIGGAALSSELKKLLKKLDINNIYETFGMTETLSHIAIKHTSSTKNFTILDGITIHQNKENCLVISDDYLEINNLETNDIVEIVSPKEFRWKGRLDNVINSGGIKYLTEEIEAKIKTILPDKDLLIFSKPHPSLGSEINLLIEGYLETNQPIDKDLFKSILSKYEIPKNIYYYPKFIRSSTKKVLRKETLHQAIID